MNTASDGAGLCRTAGAFRRNGEYVSRSTESGHSAGHRVVRVHHRIVRSGFAVVSMNFCSLACFLALAGALSGCATGSGGESMTDDKITANVQAMINKHSDVGPPDSIHVETRDHVVYLSGLVSTGLMKSTAEDLAQHSRGVTKVVSDIAVTK
jgi:hypothetical protein